MVSDPQARFGLSPATIEKLRGVFARHARVRQVILYGSRAKGNYRPGSDIDLTVRGEGMSLSDLLRIANEIDDLLLPYKVDLSLLDHIENSNLRDHIRRVGKVFYSTECLVE